jgi:DNA-binding protein H-NS
MKTLQELIAERQALDEQITAARQAEVAGAIIQAKEIIAQFGLSVSDVFQEPGTRKKMAKVAVKYRDPKTGKTWSGRGKPPLWIAGQDRALFDVSNK